MRGFASMTDLINKSVTRFDYGRESWQTMYIPSFNYHPRHLPDPEDLPWDGLARDKILSLTTRVEGAVFGSAVNTTINQLQSAMWEVESDVALRRNRARDILEQSDYYEQLGLVARDFLTTNNGGFIEIIRATSSQYSRILGFQHLDSLRCRRTRNRLKPVIYIDSDGHEHELNWWQVISIVDAKSTRVEANGMGECAAERIYKSLYKFATIERYLTEKVGGRRPQQVVFLNNISSASLESALASGEASSPAVQTEQINIDPSLLGDGVISSGYAGGGQIGAIKRSYVFGGVHMVPVASTEPVIATPVDIASLPDGFDYDQECEKYAIRVAKSLNIDPQDVMPISGGSFGTNTQSKVMQEKNAMYGAASLRQQWQRAMQIVTGRGAVFYLVENDIARRHNEALLAKTHTEDLDIQIKNGMITPQQAVTIKVALDELPNEFATVTQTETVNQYSDSEADDG